MPNYTNPCSVEGCPRTVGRHGARGLCKKHYDRYRTGYPLITEAEKHPDQCKVDGCAKPPRTHGFCYAHYMKNWRYGTPTPEHEPRWLDLIGQQFGHLTVIARAEDKWLCQCDCGATTEVRAGDLNNGNITGCGDWRAHPRTETPGYGSLHTRIQRDRGRADDHACVDCGQQAEQWSYDHTDPNELMHFRDGGEYPYSLDINRYEPRCISCHRRFDMRTH